MLKAPPQCILWCSFGAGVIVRMENALLGCGAADETFCSFQLCGTSGQMPEMAAGRPFSRRHQSAESCAERSPVYLPDLINI